MSAWLVLYIRQVNNYGHIIIMLDICVNRGVVSCSFGDCVHARNMWKSSY